MASARTHITPPELARQRGIGCDKVLALIRTGQLPAVNMSLGTQRPRYLIALADLADFDRRHAVVSPAPTAAPRQRRPEGIPSYV